MKFSKLLILASTMALSFSAMTLPAHAQDTNYTVTDGNKLDAATYNGFKLYRNWCARCHGTYGQGMVGPNLADSLKAISKDEFSNVVLMVSPAPSVACLHGNQILKLWKVWTNYTHT